jgi:hypothetical protein
VPILLEEGEALIDAAQEKGSTAARQVRASLEISGRPATEVNRSVTSWRRDCHVEPTRQPDALVDPTCARDPVNPQ